MFQALWLALFMCFLSVGRRMGSCLLKTKKPVLLCAEYALLYTAFFAEVTYDIVHLFTHLPELAWLDPAFLELRFHSDLKNMNMTADARHQVLQTTSLKPFPALRWLSLFTPVPVFLTWLLSVWDTYRQARRVWLTTDVGAKSIRLRDRVIQIISLPMVYSLMSFEAVMRMWQIVGNQFGTTIKMFSLQGKTHYVFRVYEADYQLADLYEAWALFHFGGLVLNVIKHRFYTISAHRVFGGGAQITVAKSPGKRDSDIQKERRELEDSLHESVQKLTMQGVLSFVVCCTAQSLYGLALPLLQEYVEFMFPKVWESVEDSEMRVHDFFLGMGAIASTAAISNIVRVERVFHQQLTEFKPFWKFWGTKILVSIAFLQMLIFKLPVPPFRYMSQVHTSLMYSSMLCYECFFVALLHMYAWNANETWYGDEPSVSRRDEEFSPLAQDYDIQPSTFGRRQERGRSSNEYETKASADPDSPLSEHDDVHAKTVRRSLEKEATTGSVDGNIETGKINED